ncbi:MAG: flagellar basal body rod protein FlgC [Pseudomonadota bacterium]
MSLFSAITTASTALAAQTIRLNLTASNIANAESLASSEEDAYRTQHAIFQSIPVGQTQNSVGEGVTVVGITRSDTPGPRQYMPNHALADDEGYVFGSNVNAAAEMADMISASRAYQNNVEVMNTSKDLLIRTLSLGR